MCGFQRGKPHAASPRHQHQQEIRGTRISYLAKLETVACAAFSEESRMQLARATNTNRKSGEPYFREAGLRFLRSLRRNNRREWFEAHRQEFET